MKKGLKILLSILAFIYFSIIIVITGFLLCYNQYKITVINDNTFLLIDDKSEKYNDGDLVIVKRNPNSEIQINDEILFYDMEKGKYTVNSGTVTDIRAVTGDEVTFTINSNHDVSSQSIVGKISSAKVFPVLGKILSVIESRFGFLLLVIFPALLFFFFEAYHLIKEIREPDDFEEDEVPEETSNTLGEKVVATALPVENVTNNLEANVSSTTVPVVSTNLSEEVESPETIISEVKTEPSVSADIFDSAVPSVDAEVQTPVPVEPAVSNEAQTPASVEPTVSAEVRKTESSDVESLF